MAIRPNFPFIAAKSAIRLFLTCSMGLLACAEERPGKTGQEGTQSIPRERTLVTHCSDINTCGGQIVDYNTFNPFLLGSSSRTGSHFLYEPLYFYSAYDEDDQLIPWIATGHEYNQDFTQVTVHIRQGVTWSDGTPWTAADLAYTVAALKENAPELFLSTDMETWVERVEVEDELTARFVLKQPNPRFVFNYLTNCFFNGIVVVPKHIWEGEDPKTFENCCDEGQPVVSGPYRLSLSVPQQRILTRRDDWWAAEIGFHALPEVEQLIFLPYMDEAKRVQALISNDIDIALDLRPPNIKTALDENANVVSWTGEAPPYGYVDWWPVNLGFNNLEDPFRDVQIRHAINHAINREELVAVGWQGAGKANFLPFPNFPALQQYLDGVAPLVEKYGVATYDTARTAAIMRAKGWRRDEEGLWAQDGARFKIPIDIGTVHQDLAPVLVAQLRRAGFNASHRMTADSITRMAQGTARAFMMGSVGSIRDPYFTLNFFHSRYVQPTGTHSERYWRWRNAEFDQLVDRMGRTPPDDPKLVELFRAAMDIWLRELPAIPLVQWYHRIPHNQTYWANWPSEENPYINSAYWHKTWLLVLLGIKAAR